MRGIMNTLKKFLVNASLMSVVSVLLRIVSVYFSVWLARKIGEEGMGIYGLTNSVYRLGITFASSGISFAATRIIAEELEKKNSREALRTAEKSVFYSLILGIATSVFFFSASEFLSEKLLGDARCIPSVKIMSVSLPFLVMSSVINAYFTGVRQLSKPAVCMIFEQCVRVGTTMFLLRNFNGENLEYGCFAVVTGGVFAEIFSFLLTYIFYAKDSKRLECGKSEKTKIGRRIFSIALPVALSSYIRSGLLTVEHMMIPSGLRKYGVDSSRALGLYGIISGMVFPVLFFPSSLLYAASDLVVPEFAACNAGKNSRRTLRLTNKVMQLTCFFSVGVAGILFGFSKELGRVLYANDDAGLYLKMLAPLVIFMFFDHLADAILKGLGKQLSVVGYNVIDSVLSVVLVWRLVPKFGIGGYIFVVWFGEVLNCTLSAFSLVKETRVRIRLFNWFIFPSLAVSCALILVKNGLFFLHGTVGENSLALAVAIVLTILVYSLIMRLIGCISLHDYHLLRRAFKTEKKEP